MKIVSLENFAQTAATQAGQTAVLENIPAGSSIQVDVTGVCSYYISSRATKQMSFVKSDNISSSISQIFFIASNCQAVQLTVVAGSGSGSCVMGVAR